MNERHIEKLANEIVRDIPSHHAYDIMQVLQDLNYLNDKGMLHPSHDDTFLWDREILETEYPKICAEIRADERRKVIDAIKWNVEELAKRGDEYGSL